MQLDNYVLTLGTHLKKTFGTRVKKLTINAAFTCPNRDGSLGKGGCTFCNVDAFNHHAASTPIKAQLEQGKQQLKTKADKYLAYFQAYTSTYQEVAYLKEQYDAALQEADIVGLCVGTRPDCVPEEVLQLLYDYKKRGLEVWLELGLQSAHDKTLKKINRGHDFSAYIDAVTRADKYGIKICTHLILGLPGETTKMMDETLQAILKHPLHGLKLHPLHIVTGSIMAKAYQAGKVEVMAMQQYAKVAAKIIRQTPKHIIFHRVSATAQRPELIAPLWCERRWPSIVEICKELDQHGPQGCQAFN